MKTQMSHRGKMVPRKSVYLPIDDSALSERSTSIVGIIIKMGAAVRMKEVR